VRSFETPQPRSAPTSFTATTLDGRTEQRELKAVSLVIAIKTSCDGCRMFVESDLDELRDLEVETVFVSASSDEGAEWRDARHEIVVAPTLLEELDVRWPPFYVLIDTAAREVLVEGVAFSPGQVADEIRSYLPR
jgi:hypothetical protein